MNDQALGHLPAGWSWSRFDGIGSVSLGRQRSPANHVGPAMRPYVRAANITWTGLDLTDVKEMNFDDQDFERFRLQAGDVLINEGSGSATEVGKPAIWHGEIADCCFQNTLLRIQPKACLSEYVYNFIKFSAVSGQFVPDTQGVNIFHIGRERLARQAIPVPPLSEQRRIVTKIDSLSTKSIRARNHINHVPKLVERYKRSIIEIIFDKISKDSRSLGINSNIITSGSRGWAAFYSKDGPLFIRVGNIVRGTIELDFSDVQHVVPPINSEGTRTRVLPGDVLVTITADLGRIGVVPVDIGEAYVNQHVALIRLRDPAEGRLVAWYLASPKGQQQLLERNRGATRAGLGLEDIRAVEVPIVGAAQRAATLKQISAAFAWIDRLAAEATSARKLIDRLDQAVLSKAFRGELVPQDPADEPASVLLERIRAERIAAPKRRRGRRSEPEPVGA